MMVNVPKSAVVLNRDACLSWDTRNPSQKRNVVWSITTRYSIIQAIRTIFRSKSFGVSAHQAPHGPMTKTNWPRPWHLASEGRYYISPHLFESSNIRFHICIHLLEIIPVTSSLCINCLVFNLQTILFSLFFSISRLVEHHIPNLKKQNK